jgi:hypothetical protein
VTAGKLFVAQVAANRGRLRTQGLPPASTGPPQPDSLTTGLIWTNEMVAAKPNSTYTLSAWVQGGYTYLGRGGGGAWSGAVGPRVHGLP